MAKRGDCQSGCKNRETEKIRNTAAHFPSQSAISKNGSWVTLEARILRPNVYEGKGRIEATLLSIVTDCVCNDSRFYAAFADAAVSFQEASPVRFL